MRVVVTDKSVFSNGVFGGNCFLNNFPEITTEGVQVIKYDNMYYVTEDGEHPADTLSFNASTCFFSEEELNGNHGCNLIY